MVMYDKISLVFKVGYLCIFCDSVEYGPCFKVKINKFKPRRLPNIGIILLLYENVFIKREMRYYFGLRKLQ